MNGQSGYQLLLRVSPVDFFPGGGGTKTVDE